MTTAPPVVLEEWDEEFLNYLDTLNTATPPPVVLEEWDEEEFLNSLDTLNDNLDNPQANVTVAAPAACAGSMQQPAQGKPPQQHELIVSVEDALVYVDQVRPAF